MGGGFDLFCGLPIYFELQRRGYSAHLANLSFAELRMYSDCERLSPTLIGTISAPAGLSGYHPERFLARWLVECKGEKSPIWCFDATGAEPLLADYRKLVSRLNLNVIILIGGGVDSLARGDEELCGSILEDFMSLKLIRLAQRRAAPGQWAAAILRPAPGAAGPRRP